MTVSLGWCPARVKWGLLTFTFGGVARIKLVAFNRTIG
jgi:hypothetical protein